jgi:hypothetical protein
MVLYQKTVSLSSYKLDRTDFASLLKVVREGIDRKVIAAYTIKDGDKIYYELDEGLAADKSIPDKIKEITISLSEEVANVGDKVIQLSLGKQHSALTVWSSDSMWVEGKCKQVTDFLKRYASRWQYYYGKCSTWINTLIFLCLLVILPSLNILNRLIITTGVFILLALSLGSYFYENTAIYLRKRKVSPIRKHIADFVVSVISGIIITVLALLLNKFLGTP